MQREPMLEYRYTKDTVTVYKRHRQAKNSQNRLTEVTVYKRHRQRSISRYTKDTVFRSIPSIPDCLNEILNVFELAVFQFQRDVFFKKINKT